jgi:hypothetical protein
LDWRKAQELGDTDAGARIAKYCNWNLISYYTSQDFHGFDLSCQDFF